MGLFDGQAENRIGIVQDAHPLVAWLLLMPATLAFAACAVLAAREGDAIAWLLAIGCAIAAVLLGWMTFWIATEADAVFDGVARTATVTWRSPWGETSRSLPFAEVVDVVLTDIWLPDGKDYRIDILLAGAKRIRLRSNGGQSVEERLTKIRQLLRRP
ncbi:MAG: hypothetical protein JNL66_05580 [Alphaproteobacteria bacterium]|nr:hypothetical protein [Alphaproteobacteria bacterium]